jgi:DNA gyrase subunit A
MVRTSVKDIRETGRNTQGVKLIELEQNDRLKAIAPVISEERQDVDVATEPTPTPPPAQP